MKAGSLLIAFVAGLVVAITPQTARATDGGPPWDFEYVYSGSPTQEIPDDDVRWYVLEPEVGNRTDNVVYMELEIKGLSHTAPMDLNIILTDPFGGGIEIMDDAGDQLPINDVDIVFTDFKDLGIPLPRTAGDGPILTDTIYLPDGPGQFMDYEGRNLGSQPWIVVVIDDDPMDDGSFESITLRGRVPEPATLSLLALGALVMLRRRRR